LDQAVAALAQGRLTVLAGGTDIYPAHVARPIRDDILDIGGLEELIGIDETDDCYRIGAATPWHYLLNNDLSPHVGNVCNASPAADGVPMLMAMDAYVELSSMHGVRKLPVGEFVIGNRRTAIFSDELLSAIIIPKAKNDAVSGFKKLGARRYLVISIVSVAGAMEIDRSGIVTGARFAVGSCSEVAQRLPILEHEILGRNCNTDFAALVAAHQFSHLRPIDDIRATASYRLEAVETMTKRLLDQMGGRDG
jgi:CO/xanthine dehydrogenase FAD-binding subunit